MGSGVKGPGGGSSPNTVSSPGVEETKKGGSPTQAAPPETKEEPQKPQGPSGRSAEALKHDTSVTMRKAALSKAAGLTKPTKAQLEEIRTAIKDGKKDEAIKLTIKYYNIDTSGAHEVKYAKSDSTAAPAHAAEQAHAEHIGTGTHKRGDKISIEIGDESFQFKGKESPEWLAGAIYHEAFHAKNHFKPDKPVIVSEPPEQQAAQGPKMTQQELAEEIQAYMQEQKASDKLGFNEEMLAELNNRRNKLYAQLTPENREILSPILRGTKPWPQ